MTGSRSVVVIDGKQGPVVDELLATTGEPSLTCVNSVLFSPDGRHHAYAARIGDQYVVIRDGKELYRGAFASRTFSGGTGQLAMSPRGQHVSFMEMVDVSPSQHGWRLVVDGKPGPLSSNNNSFRLVYSPDDSRWAYTAAKLNGKRDETLVVVDGKEVADAGHHLRFTGNNQLVTMAAGAGGLWSLAVEGKTVAKSLVDPERRVWVAAKGSRIAAVVRKGAGLALWTNEGDVAAANGVKDVADVVFSPDGKRYLAVCQTGAAHFVVADGEKHPEYRLISYPQFTRDSSRAIYVATSGSKSFVVVDGTESEGFEILGGQDAKIAMPEAGARYAYSTGDGMNRVFSLVADAKPVALPGKAPAHDSLRFSADGSSYALAAGPVGRSEITSLIVNGEEYPDFRPQSMTMGARNTAKREAYFVLSRDGQRVAALGRRPDGGQRGLYVNRKLLYPSDRALGQVAFSRDGKHTFWMAQTIGQDSPVPQKVAYVDGVAAVTLPGGAFEIGENWEMTDDDVYRLVAFTEEGIKRYEIRADPAMDTDQAIAAVEKSREDSAAAATAATQQAQDEAAAAKEAEAQAAIAAAEKAKADRAAYEAKRKAALEAKTKARRDALEARKKAQTK